MLVPNSRAYSQYSSGVGIETAASGSILQIYVPRIIYTGECPGDGQITQTSYFVSDSFPPSPGLLVRLTNMSRGLSPDNPPFTLRDYSKGRASQSFEVALGSRHRGQYFIVKQGENVLQYEIIKAQSVIRSGIFQIYVSSPTREQPRAKKKVELTKFRSDGTSYQEVEYRCE